MQTKQGAIKARDKILKTRPDHYKTVGALGGKVKVATKGFGSDTNRASEAGRKGGVKKCIPQEDAQYIKDLRSQGATYREITQTTGRCYQTVYKYCNEK